MWRHEVELEGGVRLVPLRTEHADLMARLLTDHEGAHWTGVERPDPADPLPWVSNRLGKTPACYVVMRGDEALGYAQLRLEAEVGSPALWLAASQRQRGHGSRVIQGLSTLGRQAGLDALVTGIRVGNVASQAAFLRGGWSRTSWRLDAPFRDCRIWAVSLAGVASRSALDLAAERFYRASTPLLGLRAPAAT